MSKQSDADNHANQMTPNNDAFWQSRGEDDRPDDWHPDDGKGKDPAKDPPPSKLGSIT